MIPQSIFSLDGVDVGSANRNLTYLYGISDFFNFIFEDTTLTNLMLESNALKASEIYSKFLQLTSTLTISGIQTDIGSGIELILISDADLVVESPQLPKYKITRPFSSAKVLANRPFLPTEYLDENIDFRITQTDTTSCVLQFARPITEYAFSQRVLADGTNQYAIWATDVVIDEQLMYKYYGKLLGVVPEVSSEQFSNFIYGLYYLYINGPTLKVLEQGLNLVLGIPLPRQTSTVLDIRLITETGQYLVITEDQEYLLPVGIAPSVGIGDIITLGTAIAKWIELQDFISDGKWWLNVSIPSNIIRAIPTSQPDRFAFAGSSYDNMMTNYLYKNTFLISINVGSFQNNQYFSYLNDIILKAKPSYAQAIFVWKVNMGEDDFGFLEELEFSITQRFGSLRSINAYPINAYLVN